MLIPAGGRGAGFGPVVSPTHSQWQPGRLKLSAWLVMQLIYAGFAVFFLTALLLLLLGRSIGTELLVLGGGLFAIFLFIAGAITAIWRLVRQVPRRR
jgi:hypothetical protein